MKYAWVVALLAFVSFSAPASAQRSMKMGDKSWNELEKTLDDVNQQWLCVGRYNKPKRQECVDFRAQYWADQFFEVSPTGKVQTKEEMVASQTAGAPAADKLNPKGIPGVGPNPQEFKLMAVYGNIALATDHTIFKTIDASGNLSVTSEAQVLRMFVKENGKWRPAGAVLGSLTR
jgi:hypothetical protein